MDNIVYTIGHSTHELPYFIRLLKIHKINMLVDVRSYPSSRHVPQFNRDTLADGLLGEGVNYTHIESLGGRRRKCCDESHNDWWTHASFRNYADYAELDDEFYIGLSHLRKLCGTFTVVYMCAEAVWWKCHRRIISDYLLSLGVHVKHIAADGTLSDAVSPPEAKRRGRSLIYRATSIKIPNMFDIRKHARR